MSDKQDKSVTPYLTDYVKANYVPKDLVNELINAVESGFHEGALDRIIAKIRELEE